MNERNHPFFLKIAKNTCVHFLGKLHSFSVLQQMLQDTSWIRGVATSLSLPSPFPRPTAVGFVMDEVEVGEFLSEL